MGEFNTIGLEEVAERFGRLEAAATEAIPKMLEAGAEVLVKAQQEEAASMGIKETAGFIQSIKATPIKGGDSEKHIEIYPQGKARHGYDRKGDRGNVRYATIGFVNEYGTSEQAARPYMSAANTKKRDEVTETMFKVWQGATNGKN